MSSDHSSDPNLEADPSLTGPPRSTYAQGGGDAQEPLPSFQETLASIRAQEQEGSAVGYEVAAAGTAPEPYVGYWADLVVKTPSWRLETRLISVLVVVVLFLLPIVIDGMW
ncbi:MAG: hypothetical protein ACYDHU_03125 [Acidimicrobiales bacterium]